ncbi:cuticle-degrading protease [Eremomyces bilateralis CBS 781.70]|uniref:Cuticle-degrading protease n=1 Tax=Eremomyces bilateralis CBS 781.70 TaxID=1392243 RepID=A0A6G1GE60_9PEZI|nr:cuticle-degrading protease [Eremomyces bilateralis CBS 781.70]KAF1816322.1 cuticle-degrading protease [Eremomyces bilateralis CBS 781.70]
MRGISSLALLPLALAAPTFHRRDELVPGKYIVVLSQDFIGAQAALVPEVERSQVYDAGSFKGFSAELSDSQVQELENSPQANGIAHTTIADPDEAVNQALFVTQSGAPSWGLGRVSHRQLGNEDYTYYRSAGEGTCAYIVDTGVYAEHVEFEGRATFLANFATNAPDATTDDNGHGTHVAGTIGSAAYGVAKKTQLYGIKVLDRGGYGYWSDVIAGIDFAVEDSKNRTNCPKGYVANMSLGGYRNQALNDAVAAAVDAGIFFAVAAGNDGFNADGFSPASEPKAFTVGATDSIDNQTAWSNYGQLVDAFAPGDTINSTYIGGADSWRTLSGTSMATPHVAGLGAYLLSVYGKASPSALGFRIKGLSTKGAVKNTVPNSGTPNYLVFNGATF